MSEQQRSQTNWREIERLVALQSTALLDSPAEAAFDQFTQLASTALEAPVALISLVDQERQFFKSSVGLSQPWASARQTPLSHSFCKHVVQSSELLTVSDAREHSLLRDNLAVSDLDVIAYLGIPLTTSEGHTLGSFCVIDSKPRQWSDRQTSILQQLAHLVLEKIELRTYAKHLHEDYLALRQLELYRQEMTQMLVHDLRNPMFSFMSGLELAQLSGNLSSDCCSYVDLARKGGNELLKMINSLLEVSQARAGKLTLKLNVLRAHDLVAAVCTEMTPLAKKAGCKLFHSTSETLSCRADADKLRRVLINLIGNAIQHTPEGGSIGVLVELCDVDERGLVEQGLSEPSGLHLSQTTTANQWAGPVVGQIDSPTASSVASLAAIQDAAPKRTMTESTTESARALKFSVVDTGKGIPAQAFEQIFQKFSQTEPGNVAEASTGLGLSFSRMVVETHGGRIWLDSKLGQGTCFHFTIPCNQN